MILTENKNGQNGLQLDDCDAVNKPVIPNTYVEKPNEDNLNTSCISTNSTCKLTPTEVEIQNPKKSCQKSVSNFADTKSTEEKVKYREMDELMARAIFSSSTPFSIVENTHWLNFFKVLRPSYTPPSRYVISFNVNNQIKNSKVYGIQIDVTTSKPFVFKTIDSNTEHHTGEYIATELSKVIDDLDRNKCLGVVTDNASSMKKAWILLQKDDRYKNLPIAFYPCICHTLNLLIADIIKLKSCKEIERKSKIIVKNIISSHILKGKCNVLLYDFLITNFTNIQKAKKIDCSLKLPVKTRWGSFCICLRSLHKNKNILQQLAVSEDLSVIEILDKSVKHNILSDEFWELVESIITLIKQNILNEAFDRCFDMTIHPIHYAANVLDPKYQGKDLPQGCDIEGIVYIQKVAHKLLTSIEYNKIIIELAEYRSHKGLWAKDILWNNIDVTSAILSLPASSAATERSFSSYSLIHTKRRNRLTNLTAKKLLFIYEHINIQDLEVSKSVKSVPTNQKSFNTNNDDEEPFCSYQSCSSRSENGKEDYNTDDIVESEGEPFGETDSSDDDFFNSIQHTLA
ncbi:hypothetical protein QTP88_026458 [Uroleucon formosanum]